MPTPKPDFAVLAQVAELHGRGLHQHEIADTLRIPRHRVHRYQKRLGLPTRTQIVPRQERKIRHLLQRKRWGVARIALHVHVSKYQVLKVRDKIKFRRVPGENGYHWKPSRKQLMAIIDMALSHRYSIAAIARIANSPYKSTIRLCHAALQCEKFIPEGQGAWGLDSYLPSRYRSAMKKAEPKQDRAIQQLKRDEEATLYIVDAVSRACFDGKVPADTDLLIDVCLEVCTAIFRRERPEVFLCPIELRKIRAYFEPRFHEAIATFRLADGRMVH